MIPRGGDTASFDWEWRQRFESTPEVRVLKITVVTDWTVDLKVSNIGGKVMVVEDDDRMEKNDYGSAGGDYGGAPPQDDDGNYYRRQGDVPSPGVGH
ncbi:hypothetical protein ACOSQ4_032635 [Xanthoceras sorbifolium]